MARAATTQFPPRSASVRRIVFGRGGIFGICFQRNFDLGPFFQLYFFPLFVREGIFEPDLLVKIVGPLYRNLCLFRHLRDRGLDNFFDSSGKGDAGFFG